MAYVEPRDYAVGAGGSLLFHALIVYAFVVMGSMKSIPLPVPDRGIIRAELVSLDQLQKPEAAPAQRVIDLTRQPPAAAPPAPERIQAPAQPRPAPAPTPAPPPERVQTQPQQTSQADLDRRAENDRLQREQQDQLRRQSEMSTQLEAEMNALTAMENQQVVMTYAAWIAGRVESSWSRPPSARSGMVVKLRVNLLPTGRVAAVDVIESSGDEAFDRSAVLAVGKAEPYTRLAELEARIFDEHFRQFVFVFNPQDLRL